MQRAPFWRGKVIGGTGAVNTMIYMRGNPNDYDEWDRLGNKGWSFKDCLPYFEKLDKLMQPEFARHSTVLKDAFLNFPNNIFKLYTNTTLGIFYDNISKISRRLCDLPIINRIQLRNID